MFWFCPTVLFPANLRCDRATGANADALAFVAEAVIAVIALVDAVRALDVCQIIHCGGVSFRFGTNSLVFSW